MPNNQVTVLEFGDFSPDGGAVNNSGLWFCRNAIKLSDDYESFPVLFSKGAGPNSGADAPLGIHYHIKREGKDPLVFWGTSTKLYVGEDDSSSITWYDASASSYTTTEWSFASFGPTVIATNGTDALQGYTVDDTFDNADNFAALLVTTSPTTANIKPKHLCVYKNHVFAANITMAADWPASSPQFANGTLYPELVWWSDTDNATRFGDLTNSPTLKNSGWFLLYDGQGEITGMASALDTLYVFKERAIYRCDGSPFTFSPVSKQLGTKHAKSIAALNDEVYFWSAQGPSKVDSSGKVTSLGSDSCYRSFTDAFGFPFPAIEDTSATFTIIRSAQANSVHTVVDSVNDLVAFFITTSDDDSAFADGDGHNSLLVYNARTNQLYFSRVQPFVSGAAGNAGLVYPYQANSFSGSILAGVSGAVQSTSDVYYVAAYDANIQKQTNDLIYFRPPFSRFGTGASRITKIRPIYEFINGVTGGTPLVKVAILTRQTPHDFEQATVTEITATTFKSGWIDTSKCPQGFMHSIGIGLGISGGSTTYGNFRDIVGVEVEYAPLGVRSA